MLQRPRETFVYAQFLKNWPNYSQSLKQSINKFYTNPLFLAEHDSQIDSQILSIVENHKFFRKSPGSLKIISFTNMMKKVTTKWIFFLDRDIIFNACFDNIISSGEKDKVDLIFSVRKDFSERYLNTGVFIANNNAKVFAFIKNWNDIFLKNLSESLTDDYILQQIFSEILTYDVILDELSNSALDHYFDVELRNLKIRFYKTDYINSTNLYIPSSLCFHLKGLVWVLISRDLSDIRFYKGMIKLLIMQDKQLEGIIGKIKLWSNFEMKNHFLLDKRFIKFLNLLRKLIPKITH
jgi:hypothetical protein